MYFCDVIRRLIISVVAVVVSGLTAGARESADTLAVAMVTAEKAGVSVMPATDTVSAARLKVANNVADAVRFFGGVQVKDYGGVGGLKTINVRSLGSEHTGVFLDGFELDNAQNMQVDLGRFATDNLSRIEVYEGQKSGTLQTARESGSAASVHMTSSEPVFKKGKKTSFFVGIRGGWFGTINPSLKWSYKVGKNTTLTVSGEVLSSNGRYKYRPSFYDTTLVRQNGDIFGARAEIRLAGKPANGSWSAHLYYYDSERGLPGPVVRRAEGFPFSADRQLDRSGFAQGRWSGTFGRYSIAAAGRYSIDYLHYATHPEINPNAVYQDVYYLHHNAYASVAHRYVCLPWLTVSGATDIQYEKLNSDLARFVEPSRAAFYASASAAATIERFKASANILYTMTADFYDSPGTGAFARKNTIRHSLSPFLSLLYSPVEGLELKAFTKYSTRTPTFNELYYTLIGNASLNPEKAFQNSFNATYSILFAEKWRLSARAGVYYNLVRDKIVAIPTMSQFRWSMKNIGKVDILGSEEAIDFRHEGEFEWGISARYTFQRALDLTDPKSNSYGAQIQYVPRHSGSVAAEAEWKGWRADVSFLWTGTRYTVTPNLPEYALKPWTTLDVRLSKTFLGITVAVSLNNICNTQYEVVRGYPMPGFNLLASASYTF